MIHRCHRVVWTVLFLAAAVACGAPETGEQQAAKNAGARPAADRLESALLTEADLSGYRRRAVTSGTLRSLGYQEVFDRFRDLNTNKPECLTGYLGGISGPAFDKLQQAPAAMAVFAGSPGSFGQIIVSLPTRNAAAALDQPLPPECSEITVDLPDGGTMTMSTQEIDVGPLGDQTRAFRGRVVVRDKSSSIMSETIRSDNVLHNIQLQGHDRKTLEKLAKRAVRKAQRQLA